MAHLRFGPVSLLPLSWLDVGQLGLAISAAVQLGAVRELADMARTWPAAPFVAMVAVRLGALPVVLLACAAAVKTGLELRARWARPPNGPCR